MTDTSKFLSKKELELQEVNYIFSLRAERDELQERCDRYENALTKIYNLHYCLNPTEKGKCGLVAHDALAAIGEDDEKKIF